MILIKARADIVSWRRVKQWHAPGAVQRRACCHDPRAPPDSQVEVHMTGQKQPSSLSLTALHSMPSSLGKQRFLHFDWYHPWQIEVGVRDSVGQTALLLVDHKHLGWLRMQPAGWAGSSGLQKNTSSDLVEFVPGTRFGMRSALGLDIKR